MPDNVNEELGDDFEEESLEQDAGSSDEESGTADEAGEGTVKKKDSNWKKLRERNKELETELAELKKKEIQKEQLPKGLEKADWLEFALDNPEAKEVKDEVFALMRKHPTMSMEEAFATAKATKPKQSKSKTDFDFRSNGNRKRELKDVPAEEAVNLPPKEFLAWERMQGTNV